MRTLESERVKEYRARESRPDVDVRRNYHVAALTSCLVSRRKLCSLTVDVFPLYPLPGVLSVCQGGRAACVVKFSSLSVCSCVAVPKRRAKRDAGL